MVPYAAPFQPKKHMYEEFDSLKNRLVDGFDMFETLKNVSEMFLLFESGTNICLNFNQIFQGSRRIFFGGNISLKYDFRMK